VDLFYIIAGAAVGFIVGLTGVGGGSLMTPLLVLGFNIQPAIAVGTDLLYAAITKSGGLWTHQKLKNIDWDIVKNLGLGSVPSSIVCVLVLQHYQLSSETFDQIISVCLGFMLILTSGVIIFKDKLSRFHVTGQPRPILTISLGAVLGVVVTLSSVGAGAICSALLFMLYPSLKARRVVGTDIAHAVPLTAIAGFGHFQLGHVDYQLLISLLIGSLPAIHFGANLGEKLPDRLLKQLLATILFAIGLKFAI
jgi:uncharacterized membrane protein YfcA